MCGWLVHARTRPRSECGGVINQVCPGQLHPRKPRDKLRHLCDGIEFAQIATSGVLFHVAIEMLLGKLVVDPDLAAFQHRPERLNAVGMRQLR